jgi:hypothetical protein
MTPDCAVAAQARISVPEPSHLVGRAMRAPAIPAEARSEIAMLAEAIRAEEPRIGDTDVFSPHAKIGWGGGPAVLIGDTGEIPLMMGSDRHHLDYRFGWLARSGDLVLVGGVRDLEFEAYQRSILGEPGVEYLHLPTEAEGFRRAAPIVCLHQQDVFNSLLSFVRDHGAASLVAHITTGSIWALASRLGEAIGAPVHVAGPPPLLSRCVNDKLWFGSVASRLLGASTIPEKRHAHSFSALVHHIMDLVGTRDRLVVKVPDSAGSAGNIVVESESLRGIPHGVIFEELRQRLSVLGAPPPFPVAVEVWDCNVLSSPSIQIWIPRTPDEPVVEAIYEQVLEEDDRQFVGAVETYLPEELDRELSEGGMQLALLFQALGYYGRCSFDTVVYGPNLADAKLHWIECNGRWGGVSIPMALLNRLLKDRRRPPHVIVQKNGLNLRPRPFRDVWTAFADAAPRPEQARGTVFLSPNRIVEGTGCHFLLVERTQGSAIENSKRVISLLSV